MFDRTTQELGYVDAFVSNAGVIHKAAPLADIPVEEIKRIIDVDLTAHLICLREAVRRMGKSRGGQGGAIVAHLVDGLASSTASGGFIPYGAAKGGIDVLTQGLGKEVAGDGIRVNGLRPGLIDTDMQDDTGMENRIATLGADSPHRPRRHGGRSGRGRALAAVGQGELRDGDDVQRVGRALIYR